MKKKVLKSLRFSFVTVLHIPLRDVEGEIGKDAGSEDYQAICNMRQQDCSSNVTNHEPMSCHLCWEEGREEGGRCSWVLS